MKNFLDRFVCLRDEVVEGGEGGGAAAPDAAALATELAALKTSSAATAKELATAKTSLSEKDTALQFWHEKATKGAPAAAAAVVEDDVDLLDVIGTKGTKGLKEILNKAGYVSKADVENLIAAKVDQVSREGTAVERFPELKDKDSDFFKQTRKNVAALKEQGITGVNATEIAAERTYLQMLEDGTMDTKAQRKVKADKAADDEDEADRVRAGAAASGASGRRTPAAKAGGKQELDATQKSIIKAMGITEEAYIKRADMGVQFGR